MPHHLYPVPHRAALSPTEGQVACEKEGREEAQGLRNSEPGTGGLRAAQESLDSGWRERTSDGCPVVQLLSQPRSRPASDLLQSLGQGTDSPGAVSQLRAITT